MEMDCIDGGVVEPIAECSSTEAGISGSHSYTTAVTPARNANSNILKMHES
jgi:hypothetical protein